MYNGAFNEPESDASSATDSRTTQPLAGPPVNTGLIPAALSARGERFFILGLLALALSIGIGIGTIITRPANADRRISLVDSKGGINDPSMFSRVANVIHVSVVNITSVEDPGGRGGDGIFSSGRRTGTGSGVILDKEGYILTNNHVVEGANKITVRLYDDTSFKGTVIGTDPDADLAVVKIDPHGRELIAAKMGDSDKLQVGDWVLAIGSPFGLAQTVTQGIISAKERVTEAGSALQQFLQTDAAINPGNSGGPLVNLNGEVVGINTQIATRTGTYNGIGFALPSSTAVDVYNQLVNGGQVHRGYLGILPARVPAQMAKQNNIPEGEGALVNDVSPDDGPAAKAGVKSGDIILEFNGNKIKDDRDLVRRVSGAPVGTNAVLKFVRDGQVHTVNIKLAERPPTQSSRLTPRDQGDDDLEKVPPTAPGGGSLGVEVETFTARNAEKLGMKPMPGVLITNVIEGSVAEDAGLRRNYIILQVNKTTVTTADEYNKVMKSFKSGDEVILQVARRTQTGDRLADETLRRIFIPITIP